ncbi:MAG: hypothetical protein VKJ44_00535 [Synechococcus sp.]|nr:hypothetical protein [Synechococcus sp.]
MREIVFHVVSEHPGRLEAQAHGFPLRITAASHEELQHEAREALIAHLGPTHGTYRVRLLRQPPQPPAGAPPIRPPSASGLPLGRSGRRPKAALAAAPWPG